MGTIHEYLSQYIMVSRWFFLKMKNFSYKTCRENQNTHFVFCNFIPKILPFLGQCLNFGTTGEAKNDNVMLLMCLACWINKATHTYSDYVIHIFFPRQQWLREYAQMCLCTYIVWVCSHRVACNCWVNNNGFHGHCAESDFLREVLFFSLSRINRFVILMCNMHLFHPPVTSQHDLNFSCPCVASRSGQRQLLL